MELELTTASRQKLISLGQQFPKAGNRALNKIARSAKTQIVREITKDINLKSADVNKSMTVIPSRGQSLTAIVRSLRSRRFNLIRFRARQVRKGVSVAFKKGQRKIIAGAFIGNAGRTVFKRVGKERLPIKALQAPYSVNDLFRSQRMKDRVQKFLHEAYPRVLAQELKFFFSKR